LNRKGQDGKLRRAAQASDSGAVRRFVPEKLKSLHGLPIRVVRWAASGFNTPNPFHYPGVRSNDNFDEDLSERHAHR